MAGLSDKEYAITGVAFERGFKEIADFLTSLGSHRQALLSSCCERNPCEMAQGYHMIPTGIAQLRWLWGQV